MKTSRNRIITAMIAATVGMASAPAFAMGMPFHGIAAGLGVGTEGT